MSIPTDAPMPPQPMDASALPSNPPLPSIVELKNGKVVFKQKPISFEKNSETLSEIVKFRELLEDRIGKRADGLSAIPEEHKPVIAKLVHERLSPALSKHLLQELLPEQDEDEEAPAPPVLTLSAVENGIKTVAVRNNYGLDGLPGVKAPAAVCVWRWEVMPDLHQFLPKNAREKAETRIAERVQAKLDLKKQFDALPKTEQDSILDPKGTASGKVDASAAIDLTGDSPAPKKKKKETDDQPAASTSAPKVGRPKKAPDPEKMAKEKEKQEKKAAKAEREQKEQEAQSKSRNMMKNFFTARAAASSTSSKPLSSADASPSPEVSQYHKTFRPFVVKKDTVMAPVNWFASQTQSRLKYDGDVIIVDEDEHVGTDFSGQTAKERLQTVLAQLPPSLHHRPRPNARRSSLAPRLKTHNPVSTRDLMAQLTEAEVAGDVSLVRAITSKLADRELVPAKVLIFTDDARPGYFGTWSRDSRIIGPRSALKRDVAVFDYDYDSGEEWEEEPAGDADDIVDDGEDEDVDGTEADSDADSWLVDDDDEPVTMGSSRGASPVFPVFPAPAKRKAQGEDSKIAKKRKVVVPLVPFGKGPCWEETIGQCEHTLFNPYRIQLLNDTPFPIDPFTFISQTVDVGARSHATKAVFAVPDLPSRITGQADASLPLPPPSVVKRAAPAPKTTFPDMHMPHLLSRIMNTATPSLPILVDTIYQDLRDHKVKKNSIEAKVREVAEKCKIRKVWVVKGAENLKVPGVAS
ncbi:hypothetical protein MKEN_01181300 [Mycena kentingensis (nom. inval.)]|nr:hypothetical protein MKEN_01181300 [Mycena kentingensis (nom. inval.)]